MKLLAFDAALDGFSAALDLDGTIASVHSPRPDALEEGLGRIGSLLERGGIRLRALDRIAVGTGPGSFTGVRIAVAYAKSLAYASGVPLIGISSYDALEPDQRFLAGGSAPPVLTVVRGRRGVVCARLREGRETRFACGPVAEVLDRLLPASPSELAAAGNTEDVLSEIAERGWTVRALPSRADVPAVAIVQLARSREPGPSPHALAPDYGEAPAVTTPKR